MDSILLAVPSALPGGLDADVNMHFGHCDMYTLVRIENSAVASVSTLENEPHQEGGCLTPVKRLADQGVKALLAGGMGMRPLMALQDAGINVYAVLHHPKVQDAVDAYINGKLPMFSPDSVCQGGGHCHH